MSAEADTSPGFRWQDFIASPARCVSLHWVADSLEDTADEASLAVIARHPRFQQRLTERLVMRHHLTAPSALPTPAEEDLVIFQLAPDGGGDLARFCGMICHAITFVREIRAPRVVALKQRFGTTAFLTALANRALALPSSPHADADALDDGFADTVHQDGLVCIACWLAHQPDELRAWLRLGIAADPRLDELELPHQEAEQRVAIVRRAAAALATEHRRASAEGSGEAERSHNE